MKNLLLPLLIIVSIGLYSCEEVDPCEANPQLCLQEQFQEDQALMEAYISENNLEAAIHSSGIYYKANNPGVADTAVTGQFVSVDYVGRLLDGTIFDTSVDSVARAAGIYNEGRNYEPFYFQLGAGRVIQGWDIGLTFFEEGGSGFIIIPSYLAYGNNSTGNIPANSVLYFEINLLDVKY